MVSDLIRSLGCWAVTASHGAECTGKWKWTGSGGKQRRKKTQGDTGLEAEACLAVMILVDLQASLMGILLLDIERRMRSWRRNGLRKMEYGQNSAWGGGWRGLARVSGGKEISQLHLEEGSGLCSCPQLGCLYAAARGPSRSCPTAPGRLESLWIMMVGR